MDTVLIQSVYLDAQNSHECNWYRSGGRQWRVQYRVFSDFSANLNVKNILRNLKFYQQYLLQWPGGGQSACILNSLPKEIVCEHGNDTSIQNRLWISCLDDCQTISRLWEFYKLVYIWQRLCGFYC